LPIVEKITRTIFNPARNLSIKHQVTFGQKDLNTHKRKGELFKYDYSSEKYIDTSSLSSLILQTSDFIFLEKTSYDKEVETERIFLSYPHLFKLKKGLKNALKWFYSSDYEKLFLYKDNEIIFNSEFNDESVIIDNLIGRKNIILYPHIIEYENIQSEGVLMGFNQYENMIEMSVDQLEAMYDFFTTFNLYESSQLLINYTSQINPENLNFNSYSSNNNINRTSRRNNLGLSNKKRL